MNVEDDFARHFTADGKIIADCDDIEAINREYPRRSEAERYRLAQALKLIRLYRCHLSLRV
jgi:hypothetical protein